MFSPNTLTRGAAALALLGSLSLTACDSGEPEDGAGEQELITEVTLTLTNAADATDSATITATASDGLVIDTYSPAQVTLRPGATYTGSIELRDTANGIDITDEIEDEAEEHLILYGFQPASAGTATATDFESDYENGNTVGGDFAVGLDFQASVAAGASGSGALRATLYHFDAPKTSSTATSDEIDVDISFPVRFEGAAVAAN